GAGRAAGARRGAGRSGWSGAGAEDGAFAERDFSEFFSSLFGGGSPFARGGGGAARDHHARVGLELEETYRGTTRTLELRRPEVKPDGSVELRTHTVRVTIPPGVTEGQLIRLAGQGAPAGGRGRGGDLYLEVHVQPHRLFALEGRDVTLTFPVAPWEAALGGSVEMHIPAGAQSGQRLRLRGRGLPGQPPGDQYVQLRVVLPPASSPQAKALYEEMRGKLDFDPRASLSR